MELRHRELVDDDQLDRAPAAARGPHLEVGDPAGERLTPGHLRRERVAVDAEADPRVDRDRHRRAGRGARLRGVGGPDHRCDQRRPVAARIRGRSRNRKVREIVALRLVLLPGSRRGRRPGRVRPAATCASSRGAGYRPPFPFNSTTKNRSAALTTLPSSMLAGVTTAPRCAGTTMKRSAAPRCELGNRGERLPTVRQSALAPKLGIGDAEPGVAGAAGLHSDRRCGARKPADRSARAEEPTMRCFGHIHSLGRRCDHRPGCVRRPEPAPARFAVGGRAARALKCSARRGLPQYRWLRH